MLGMLPQLDADIAILMIALIAPNTRSTTGIPDEPIANSAKRTTTSASLNITTHLSSVQHRQNVSEHGQQHTAFQTIRTIVAMAELIIPAHHKP